MGNLGKKYSQSWDIYKSTCPFRFDDENGVPTLFSDDLGLAVIFFRYSDIGEPEPSFVFHPDAADMSDEYVNTFAAGAEKWFFSTFPGTLASSDATFEPLALEEREALAVHGSSELRQWAILQG